MSMSECRESGADILSEEEQSTIAELVTEEKEDECIGATQKSEQSELSDVLRSYRSPTP